MRLYLVRHAHAVPEEENARRPLSARGRKTVRQIAAFFRENGALQPGQVEGREAVVRVGRARGQAGRCEKDLR